MNQHRNTLILIVIQYFSIIVSGSLGILGLFVDYKDKETKKLTLWGKRVSVILSISLILGVVSKTIEVNQESERQQSEAVKARIAAEQTLQIVKNTERLTNAIRTIDIQLSVDIPFSAPSFDGIRSRLLKKYPESPNDRDLSYSEVKNISPKSPIGEKIADELFNPQPQIWLFPKNVKIYPCIYEPITSIFEDKARTGAISFYLDAYPQTIEIPQFDQYFSVKVSGKGIKRGGPQVLSLSDFEDATIIVFMNTLVQQTSNSKTDTTLFVRYNKTAPMEADGCSLRFYINQDKSVYINNLKLQYDKCSRYPYFIGRVKLQDQ